MQADGTTLVKIVTESFDEARDGFVLAEGAAVLLLEELACARARGARILAEVRGYAATADATHVTRPAPGGSAFTNRVK